MIPVDGGGLFLATLPEPPGDPAALSAAASTYTAAHGEIGRNQATLARIAGNDSEASWIGVGALTFGAVATDLATAYKLTGDALAKGATALRAYSTALTAAKETTRRANAEIALANSTARALLDAEATARASQEVASEADQTATTAAAHASANPHSPAAASAAGDAQHTATQTAATARDDWAAVTTLTSRYDAERAQAMRLAALARQQARTAAEQAASAFDNASLGFLDDKLSPAKGGAEGVDGSPWEGLVEVIEKTHTGLGFLGADGILWALGKGAEKAEDFMKELPKLEQEWLHDALPWGKGASDEEWAAAVRSWWAKADAADTFGQQFVDDTRTLGMLSRIGRVAGGPIAVAGDVITFVDPPQDGAMGTVDRVMAGTNGVVVGVDTVGAVGGLIGVDAITFSVPPVGVAVAVGTGLYLAGAYAYKHWAWFRDDFANPIGHTAASIGKGIAHGVTHGLSDLGHALGL